jgi:phosphohistidine phosphatase
LILLRHAQATPTEAGQSDHERELTPRGVAEAGASGRELATLGHLDLILASSARRTVQTASIVQRHIARSDDVRLLVTRDLYLAERDALVEYVSLAAGGSRSVVLVGHNPGLSDFATWLAPSAAPSNLDTAAALVAMLTLDSWSDLGPHALVGARYARSATNAPP